MRRLVVFCDGTWKSADDMATTNVVKAMDAVEPVGADGVSQILFYERGVGTGNILDRLSGGIFGDGLSASVRNGYRFLAQNYAPGDEIFLFGFSRGAYAARSLAGMLRCCGLVRKEHTGRISEAYGIYRMRDPGGADKPAAVAFRRAYAQEVRIQCIGVFDTVGALGVPVGRMLRMLSRKKYGFHDTALSSKVDNAFHALAIDEGRYTFEPSLWNATSTATQRVEQVWFAGAHSDVGGGYPESGLSDGALLWMLERAGEAGLTIRPAALQRKGNPHDTLHNETWARFAGLPGNIRDVARHPAFGERIDESVRIRAANASLRYAPPNYTDAVASPRVAELRRPFLVRLLRSLLGSNAVTRTAPVRAAERPLEATRIEIAREQAGEVAVGVQRQQESARPSSEHRL
jgi:uncharacterized protein (DUF2235 family)